MRRGVSSGINPPFSGLSQCSGHVTCFVLSLSPLARFYLAAKTGSYDLHVSATPPAFTLSQDQTLQLESWSQDTTLRESASCVFQHTTWPSRPLPVGTALTSTRTDRLPASRKKIRRRTHSRFTWARTVYLSKSDFMSRAHLARATL